MRLALPVAVMLAAACYTAPTRTYCYPEGAPSVSVAYITRLGNPAEVEMACMGIGSHDKVLIPGSGDVPCGCIDHLTRTVWAPIYDCRVIIQDMP